MAEEMPINQRKSRLSIAYIEAVASQAGYQVIEINVDNDSVDGTLFGDFGRRPRIEFQAKATARDLARNGEIRYPLPIKNYNELRIDTINPRILIVMLMPDDPDDWIDQTDDALCMRCCAYWTSILGERDSANKESVTVYVPMANVFDRDRLVSMMRNTERTGAI